MKKLVSLLMMLFLVPACFGGLVQECASKKVCIKVYRRGVFHGTANVYSACD